MQPLGRDKQQCSEASPLLPLRPKPINIGIPLSESIKGAYIPSQTL